MQDFASPPYDDAPLAPGRGGIGLVWWLVAGFAVVAVLGCAGILGAIAYLGTYAPETAVYTGNRVPSRFRDVAVEVGALDEDETILFFYSDAVLNVRNGFYFVSDKKVAIYLPEAGDEPLTTIAFDQIVDLDFSPSDSFFFDSEITLYLDDGRVISFPVSSDHGRDWQFFEAIQQRVGQPEEWDDAQAQRPGGALAPLS